MVIEDSFHGKWVSDLSVMTIHTPDTVLCSLDSGHNYWTETRILRVHMVPSFFKKVGAPFFSLKNGAPILWKAWRHTKMENLLAWYFSWIAYAKRQLWRDIPVPLFNIYQTVFYCYATMFKKQSSYGSNFTKHGASIFSKTGRSIFCINFRSPIRLKRVRSHMNLEILETWYFSWTVYA